MSLEALSALCRDKVVLALTGAGVSTESGIPDYRGPAARARPVAPVQYQAFKRDPEARRRYWARSVAGWGRFAGARPNAGHAALAELERAGQLGGLITQNVDRLHHAAGSREVIELHGALERVRCLECGTPEARANLQTRMLAENPGFAVKASTLLPDGDSELPREAIEGFAVVGCRACGGVLKPDVVFFGENVPKPTVESAYAKLALAEVLLVVGSSLTVFSGYRFVKRASERGIPVAIVNLGPTRGDPLATLKLEAPAGSTLTELRQRLIKA